MLDVVDIPYVTRSGSVQRVQIRVGWLIDTVVTSDDHPGDELVEVDTILWILDRIDALRDLHAPALTGRRNGHPDSSDFKWDEVV